MGKRGRTGRTKDDVARRLGEALGVEFDERVDLGPGGTATRLAAVGPDAWVALEFERKRARPADGVLRYWPWLDRTRRRLVVLHVIGPGARRFDDSRDELASWLGALMERVLPGRFTYCRLELGTKAEAEQIASVRAAIVDLRRTEITRRLAAGL